MAQNTVSNYVVRATAYLRRCQEHGKNVLEVASSTIVSTISSHDCHHPPSFTFACLMIRSTTTSFLFALCTFPTQHNYYEHASPICSGSNIAHDATRGGNLTLQAQAFRTLDTRRS